MFACVQTTSISPEQFAGELTRFIRTIVRAQQGDVFAVAAATELGFSQLRALCLLEAAEHELALTELAPLLGLSPAATGRALDALAAQGYVDRRPDAGDRRVKRLALTDAGRDTARRITTAKREALLRFAETLSDAEREQLSRALAPILAREEATS
jgi:DNA-binding MarR family transcriptional regulator